MFLTDYFIKVFTTPKPNGLGYKASSMETINYNLRKFFYENFALKGHYSNQYPDTPQGKKAFNTRAKLFPYYLNWKEKVMDGIKALPVTQQAQMLFLIKTIYENWRPQEPEILKFYNDEYEKLKVERNENITLAAPNEKQVKNILSETEYDKVFNKYTKEAQNSKEPAVLIKWLILGLYKYIPPLRPQDYINTSFKGEIPNQINYIDLTKKEIVIKEGKKTNEKNQRNISIPPELLDIIKKTKSILKSKWLIPMVTDLEKPMQRTAFTKFIQGIFSKEGLPSNIGAARLRTIKVSKMIDEGASASQLKETAKIMGHTPGTALTIYSKNSERLHGTQQTNTNEILNNLVKNVDEMRNDLSELKNTQKILISGLMRIEKKIKELIE